jgi:predicted dehydrogenase
MFERFCLLAMPRISKSDLLKPSARGFADLPGGHSEGYDDTFKQVFRRFYESIRTAGSAPEYPQFADGLRQLNILSAELRSHGARGWIDVATA